MSDMMKGINRALVNTFPPRQSRAAGGPGFSAVVTIDSPKLGVALEFDSDKGLLQVSAHRQNVCHSIVVAGVPVGAHITHIAGASAKDLELGSDITAKLTTRPLDITFSWPRTLSPSSVGHVVCLYHSLDNLKKHKFSVSAMLRL